MGIKKKSIKIIWVCPVCATEVEIYRYLAKNRKYCSNRCRADNVPLAVREKISRTNKAKGLSPPSRLGTRASKETKAKMSESQRKWYSKGGVRTKGNKLNISEDGLRRKIEATQKMRKRIASRGKLTDIERIIDDYLHLKNITHEHEYPVGAKVMDFYLPEQGYFIEADSDYWHQDKEKDLMKDNYVKKLRPEVEIVRCNEASIKDGTWAKSIIWGKKRNV